MPLTVSMMMLVVLFAQSLSQPTHEHFDGVDRQIPVEFRQGRFNYRFRHRCPCSPKENGQ